MQWPKDIRKARQMQDMLRRRVSIVPLRMAPRYIAGVDAAYSEEEVIGTVSLFDYPSITLREERYAFMRAAFPYVPGFLSFREAPAIIKAISKLRTRPGLILVDGQGIAHPRGLGIASHIGVLLNVPTIGCAKTRLVGEYREPGCQKGSGSPLRYHGMTTGTVLRTRSHVKPIFVSPGHLIDVQGAVDVVLSCVSRFRIPEPIRYANRFSKKLKG